MTTRKKCLMAGILAATLFIEACGASSVITSLRAVLAAAEVLVPVLTATGTVDPITAGLIERYLGDVTQAVDKATTILASNETTEQKAIDITKAFAGIIAPQLPPGTAQNVLALVQGVVSAVEAFLQNFKAPPATARLKPLPPLSKADASAVATIRLRNDKLRAQLLKLPH